MDKCKRRAVIAGNWKMNKTAGEASALVTEIVQATGGVSCDVVLCPPYTSLTSAVQQAAGSHVTIGAQNVHYKDSGAFTGEISAAMLCECGVSYVIVGHSERRQYFGETDQSVNRRTLAALSAGLKVILCVGESSQQREDQITEEILRMQTKIALRGVSDKQMEQIILAYEPVWAIGTGQTATAQQAQEACAAIRQVLFERYGQTVSQATTIQYGGSMNAKNAAELLAQPDIDGGLIGGASLKATDFAEIVHAASQG